MVVSRQRLAALVAVTALVLSLAACQVEPAQDVMAEGGRVTASPRPAPSATTTSPNTGLPTAIPATAVLLPVLMAAPLSLSIPRIGLEATIEEYTDAMLRATRGNVNPERSDTVAWWSGGGTPGVDANGTVFMFGHSWIEEAVFNHLKDLQLGDEIFVTTGNGTLRYVVKAEPFSIAKSSFSANERITNAPPKSLILATCFRETGNELVTTENFAVVAELQS